MQLLSIHVGPIGPLGPERRTRSAFVKHRVEGRVAITVTGVAGDVQADRRVHGGRDKAVYLYPAEHYDVWAPLLPQHAPLLRPGGMGENLSSLGLNEETTMIGDVLRVGTAMLEVTQPRQPCFKLALRFADGRVGKTMTARGWSGWYLRVREPGIVQAGDEITRLERPNPTWSVKRFTDVLLERRGTRADLEELASLSGLSASLRAHARTAAIYLRDRQGLLSLEPSNP